MRKRQVAILDAVIESGTLRQASVVVHRMQSLKSSKIGLALNTVPSSYRQHRYERPHVAKQVGVSRTGLS
jgi:hypothetical protein